MFSQQPIYWALQVHSPWKKDEKSTGAFRSRNSATLKSPIGSSVSSVHPRSRMRKLETTALDHFLALLRTASAASKWAKSVGLLQWPQKRQGPIPFTMIRDFPWGFPFTTQVLQVYWFLVAT